MSDASGPHLYGFNPPPPWARPLLRKSLHWLRWHKLLPTTRWGDALYGQLLLLYYNNRWPRHTGGTHNDLIAFMKGSLELETPLRKVLSDKYLVKEQIRQRLGEAWCVPTLAVLYNDREIDAYEFPDRCVIKPTHSSGQTLFRKAGEPINRKMLKGWLRYSHYRAGRERNYRGLVPRLIVEPWLEYSMGYEVKLNVFRGQTTSLWAISRQPDKTYLLLGLFDAQGRYLLPQNTTEARRQEAMLGQIVSREQFEQMKQAAQKLVPELAYARVDFYRVDSAIMVGEVTHCSGNGLWEWKDTTMEEAGMRANFGERGFCLEDFPELFVDRNP